MTADARSCEGVERAMGGAAAVVHLAAIATEARFADLLEHNVVATHSVFEAARRAGVRRAVVASSNHVTGFYPVTETVGPERPLRPDSLYGVTKAFGEALGRLYFDRHGLEVACLRIGTFGERPTERRHLATWLSPRDCVQLVRRCLEAEYLGFLVAYGSSGNTRSFWTTAGWPELGYEPEDDAESYAGELAAQTPEAVPYVFQGGPLAAVEPH